MAPTLSSLKSEYTLFESCLVRPARAAAEQRAHGHGATTFLSVF